MRGKSQLFLRPGNLTQPPDAYYPFLYMQFLPWPLSIQTFTDESAGRLRVFASFTTPRGESNEYKNSMHFFVRHLPTIFQPTEHNQTYTYVSRYFTTIPTVGPTVTSASRCGAASSGEKQPLKRERRKSDSYRVRMLVSKAFRDTNMFSIEERGRYTTRAGIDDGKTPLVGVQENDDTGAARRQSRQRGSFRADIPFSLSISRRLYINYTGHSAEGGGDNPVCLVSTNEGGSLVRA